MMITPQVLSPLLPEIFCALSAMLLLVYGVFRGNEGTKMLHYSVIGVCLISILLLLGMDLERQSVLNDFFVLDHFTAFIKVLVLLAMMATLAMSIFYNEKEGLLQFEYPILILLAGLGMMIMVSAGNFLALYVGLELQSLSLYVLAAMHTKQLKSAEAGIKYFILGALASGMLLFGISMIYGATGTIDFATIASNLSGMAGGLKPLFTVGMVFVLISIAFKVSAVPFHMWTPDVYEGAPTSVTALFAIVPKIAVLGILARLLYEPFVSVSSDWQQIIWVLSIGSMIVGSFAALVQTNIKRLLAYSSIGNMGYALIGFVVLSEKGLTAVLLYMTIYMVMTAGFFALLLLLRKDGACVSKLEDLSGLSQKNPMIAYGMAILLFSMSGIPPLAGFFGKFFIFEAAVAGGYWTIAIIGVLTSVVAAYYYLRLIKIMFFDESEDKVDTEFPLPNRIVATVCILFVLGFILKPMLVLETTSKVVLPFFTG